MWIIAIIILSGFNVRSQTRQDSTVLANKDIKSLLSAFDEWKYLKPENALLNNRVQLLQQKIVVKDSTIDNLIFINQMDGLIIKDYIVSEKNLIEQRTNLENNIKQLTKKIKRQKTKTFITSLAGIVGIVGAGILLLK